MSPLVGMTGELEYNILTRDCMEGFVISHKEFKCLAVAPLQG